MKKILYGILFFLLLVNYVYAEVQINKPADFNPDVLSGMAEDLWGDKIDLSKLGKGIVFMHRYSTSRCGYCLIDGDFVRENYYKNVEKYGGKIFGFSIFDPQLDIYTFQKHYREDCPVITAPIWLWDYFPDGFPSAMVFKNGKSICKAFIAPFEEEFYKIVKVLWPERQININLPPSLAMARQFIEQNETSLAVFIVPDKDKEGYKKINDFLTRVKEKWKNTPGKVVYENELKKEDLDKNLYFEGNINEFKLSILKNKFALFNLTEKEIILGEYAFPKDKVSLGVCFPNPYNRNRYIMLILYNKPLKDRFTDWCSFKTTDYILCQGSNEDVDILLRGFFEKDGNNWKFSNDLAFGSTKKDFLCEGRTCKIPKYKHFTEKNKKLPKIKAIKNFPSGKLWELGDNKCRFPAIITDKNNGIWAAWEQDGDIVLAQINNKGKQKLFYIENDSSDSFNPVLAQDNDSIWVFYLNNKTGFYKVYGKYINNKDISGEIMINLPGGPIDSFLPAAVFDKDRIVLAWTDWEDACRHLRYCIIKNKVIGDVKTAKLKQSGEEAKFNYYSNAWWVSLALDKNGNILGAWNQHYPGNISICSGNLTKKADLVHLEGGYPSIVLNKDEQPYIFWQDPAVDILDNKPQAIKWSFCDSELKKWSLPQTISDENLAVLNETPKAALDKHGNIWVCWSGRKNYNEPWYIYLTRYDGSKWSKQVKVSPEGEDARAPVIISDKRDGIWLSWHSGTGDNMKIKLLYIK